MLYIAPMSERAYMDSPIGLLEIAGDMHGVVSIRLVENKDDLPEPVTDSVRVCLEQLGEYFAGTRRAFEVPMVVRGTPFQQDVWKRVAAVPFGETVTYGTIAKDLRMNGGAQAVGAAVGANPACIVVPCHRIVAADGMGGYAYGLERKQWLLTHEKNL